MAGGGRARPGLRHRPAPAPPRHFDPCNSKSSVHNWQSNGIDILHKLDMKTTKKCKLSDWMKAEMNNSFLDALGCSTQATEEEDDYLVYDGDIGISCKYNNNS
ncbi:hypothetical protein DV515_00004989, partial [Chloebia gouldiae]